MIQRSRFLSKLGSGQSNGVILFFIFYVSLSTSQSRVEHSAHDKSWPRQIAMVAQFNGCPSILLQFWFQPGRFPLKHQPVRAFVPPPPPITPIRPLHRDPHHGDLICSSQQLIPTKLIVPLMKIYLAQLGLQNRSI